MASQPLSTFATWPLDQNQSGLRMASITEVDEDASSKLAVVGLLETFSAKPAGAHTSKDMPLPARTGKPSRSSLRMSFVS